VRLDAGADTVHWGFLDGRLKPVLSVASGEAVTISTVSGAPDVLPKGRFDIPQALLDIHASEQGRMIATAVGVGHICTGPVEVRGAKPGQALQVDIEEIGLGYDWGYTAIRPLKGALPYEFPETQLAHSELDRDRMVGRLPWGMNIPLRPFFGVIAVAPPRAWGRISTIPPRRNGGNMDNKELVGGATLYLPVFEDGALVSVGDGHAAQGDGEVCVTAIETGLVGRFRLTAREDLRLEWPVAETPTHIITMGFDPDLDDCVVIALQQMISIIRSLTGVTREDAYMLCSLAADLRITQVVNDNKGVHLMLPKHFFPGPERTLLKDVDLTG
jgi:acetamidase/formamidase